MGLRAAPPGSLVTLVEGGSFCISDPSGDIFDRSSAGATGLFVADRRVLSRFVLTVDGHPLAPVDRHVTDPAAATFVGQAAPASDAARDAPRPLVVRRRTLGAGLRDDVEVRNAGAEPTYVEIEIDLGADLAPLGAVRDGVAARDVAEPVEPAAGASACEVLLVRGRGAARVGCRVTGSEGVTARGGSLRWEAIVPARGARTFAVVVAPVVGGADLVPGRLLADGAEHRESARRLVRWQQAMPRVAGDHQPLLAALRRSARDLASLRVLDPDFPERAVVAAGTPWHRALHGRDALLTAWMSLIVDPELALGTLETLARFQGREIDGRTEEQPGRILHRLRFGTAGFGAEDGGAARAVSYGSVDATPLFVMLLGELRRWGLAPEVVDRLLPHADRALAWIADFGDRDGDGYVEYQRATDRGERHQAWKDSGSPVRHPDGRPAAGPLALAEVQGYVYAAYRARSHFAVEAGDDTAAAAWAHRAVALRAAFNRDFWLDDVGWFALALDGDNLPVPALASNVGHCLWSGIVDEDKAAVLVKHLMSDDLFSGWGLRTLAASAAAYDPLGAHTGAVWPHDTALCAAGLVRYGLVDEAHRLVLAQLDAPDAGGGRLAVLSGLDRDDVPAPVRLPDACEARAWSAAAPLLHLRSLLRLDPDVAQGRLRLAPVLPPAIRSLRVERIPLLGGTVTVAVDGDRVEVSDLPGGIELLTEPRHPLAAGA
ncbi:MAG TPA: glycogen debranching N-terminal domain-containing protein [Acidimicrobiales bacterium]